MTGPGKRGPDGDSTESSLFPDSPLEPLTSGGGDGDWLALVREAERPRGAGHLGGYELLAEVRDGGQGLVFRARQPGTGREVALKRLAAGSFSSPDARRRFEREVEVVAGLTHPGIVTVYGVEVVDGVPVLAMEWVEGETLTAWARRAPAEAGAEGQRLRLQAFLAVCEAVQHAHQNGVIHRDLKPSNVLVDRAGRPRVLDFGLARRLDAADAPEPTRTLGFVGTPAYAAPEHFTEGAAPLDVRSDVWSLGVVLYELLAGRRPFRCTRLVDLMAEIESREPPRPSTLAPGLGRDLDAVVATAIAKRPEDRYATVHALAEDVRRYLEGRPVLAAPQSAGYLLAKWLRRNRAVGALALALAFLAVGSAALGLWQMGVIADERDDANTQRGRADEARDAALAALDRAEEETRKARAVQEFFLDAILQAATPYNGVGSTDVVDVLEHAVGQVDDHFGELPEVAVEIRAQMARAFVFLARYGEAEELVDAALALAAEDGLAERVPGTWALLQQARGEALVGLGRADEGLAALEQAVAVHAALGDPPPFPLAYASALSALGTLETELDRLDEGLAHLRESLALSEAHGTEHATLMTVMQLAGTLAEEGRLDEAEALAAPAIARAEVAFGPGDLLLARLYKVQALVHDRRGEPEQAVPLRRRELAIRQRLYPPGHRRLALAHQFLALSLKNAGEHEEAQEQFERVLEVSSDPDLHAWAQWSQADCLADRGEHAAAADRFWDAWATYDLYLDPADPRRVELLVSRLDELVRAGLEDEAREAFEELAEDLLACARLGGQARGPFLERMRTRAAELGLAERAEEVLAEARASGG